MQVMQSNKWTFSLTSLIVILALVFVVPSAMAGRFNTGFSVDDLSHAGGTQTQYGQPIVLRFNFGKSIDIASFVVDEANTALDLKIDWLDENNIPRAHGLTLPTVLEQRTGRTDNKLFTFTIPGYSRPTDGSTAITKLRINIAQAAIASADPTDSGEDNENNKVENYWIHLVDPDPTGYTGTDPAPSGTPMVHAIRRVPSTGTLDLGEAFNAVLAGRVETETFDVIVVLSEQPKEGKFQATDDPKQISASEASITAVKALTPVDPTGLNTVFDADDDDFPDFIPTGRDGMVYPYLVTVMPKKGEKTVVIRVNSWQDQVRGELRSAADNSEAGAATADAMLVTTVNSYDPPHALNEVEGKHKLTVLTKRPTDPATQKLGGLTVNLPKDVVIPNGGYLVVTNTADNDDRKNLAGVSVPGGDRAKTPAINERTIPELLYNVVGVDGLPNLETFLHTGGTIDLEGPKALTITEIMWGSDASLVDSTKSQWIELRNDSGAEYKTQDGDNTTKFVFYQAHETLPAVAGVKDRVGTIGASGYWSMIQSEKGQSGASGEIRERVVEEGGIDFERTVALPPAQALISMQRVIDATTDVAADGTMVSSWVASIPPSLNFNLGISGVRIGTPGAAPAAYPEPPPVPTPAPAPPPAIPVATATDIGITEVMVDTGGGRLPQWIELTNLSSGAVSLAGWNAVIDNAVDEAVLGRGARITVSLGDVVLGVGEGMAGDRTGAGEGQSLLLVAWKTLRNSGNFNAGRVMNLATQLEQRGQYQLLSYMGFSIALMPPQTGAVATYGDTVGNLGMDWDILMAEGNRSSLIRTETDHMGMAQMGTAAAGWRLASATERLSGPTSWYGSDEDEGTPGYDSGGPLPVELSMFYPARDRLTGAVVITWETQSELNNAGFFIKRSESRNGEFKVINPQMIAGAGTTSEKQSYTYTDASAKPNVVYYYQIEDVSLDGQRQTLTLGTRLKGHIGAAGKLTTSWGELKNVQE